MTEKAKNENMACYLSQAKINNKLPNFWMSEEYVDKARLKLVEISPLETFSFVSELSLIENKEDTFQYFFPPYNKELNLFYEFVSCYCSFIDNETKDTSFLDYQYIYKPEDFLDLSGSKWRVFRKNIKKYPEKYPGKLQYVPIIGDILQNDIEDLILKWSEGRTIYDTEVFIRYVFEGENRWGLFNNGKLVGMNIFDENFYFINYRYCLDNGTPFLNEYLRYRFYTDDVILKKKKLVNDGGSLDNEGLKRFKERLNPVYIGKVYST
ncbi:MAG TPA: hypothetical protein VMV86_00530 [Methanosarcinales archaeon]|nr:hypothetical protein [Methanosarcinales archaeon]